MRRLRLLCAVLGSCAVAAPTAGADGILRVPGRGLARAAAAPASGPYSNPLSFGELGDPAPLSADGYYLFTTGPGFPIARSADLVHWRHVGLALPRRPRWVRRSGDWNPWGPSALQSRSPCPGAFSGGCFLMYYSALDARSGSHCVAVAVASAPAGPFRDLGPLTRLGARGGSPIGCGDANGRGNIDPAPLRDIDGRVYLYTATDYRCRAGAHCVLAPALSVMPLAADLIHVVGARRELIHGTAPWQRRGRTEAVEGPWPERHGALYYLFYSGGDWRRNYAMGYAAATAPTGPFLDAAGNPILKGTGQVLGPGGGSTVIGPRGGEWMLYHARLGSYAAPRRLWMDPLAWQGDGSVSVAGPTLGGVWPYP